MNNEIILPVKDVVIVGDTHGDWRTLFARIDGILKIRDCMLIHVGDVGMGFAKGYERDAIKYNDFFKSRNIEFVAIRGNHDNPAYFDGSINFSNFKLLKDYSTLTINGQLWQFVGGAVSVDRKYRIQGRDFWKGEEFVLDKSKAVKCDVLVTHTGPPWIGPGCKGFFVESFFEKDAHLLSDLLFERGELQKLYDICQPKKSYLGHFHRSEINEYHGDGYTCKARILDCLELYEHKL